MTENRWIPVTDRLPEDDVPVLVTVSGICCRDMLQCDNIYECNTDRGARQGRVDY